MSKGSLLLHPVDPCFKPDQAQLEKRLNEIGLLGEAYGDGRWLAGDQFLQLLTFMGCSPHVRFDPLDEEDNEFCHFSIEITEEPKLMHSENARTCRCSSCGKPLLKSWDQFKLDAPAWECRHCGSSHEKLTDLRWKNDAGVASFFIEIRGIYPGEAQPVPAMMKELDSVTGEEWRYFYLHTL